MGYYYPDAKETKHLNAAQQARFDELSKTKEEDLPVPLKNRLRMVRDYVGPLTGGESMSALRELVHDARVTWILGGENPETVVWLNFHN